MFPYLLTSLFYLQFLLHLRQCDAFFQNGKHVEYILKTLYFCSVDKNEVRSNTLDKYAKNGKITEAF